MLEYGEKNHLEEFLPILTVGRGIIGTVTIYIMYVYVWIFAVSAFHLSGKEQQNSLKFNEQEKEISWLSEHCLLWARSLWSIVWQFRQMKHDLWMIWEADELQELYWRDSG